VKATGLLKPFSRPTEMVVVPLAPWLKIGGDKDVDKLNEPVVGAVTATVICDVRVKLPLVPVTTAVDDAGVAELEAARVSIVVPPVTEIGLKAAVTPGGSPLIANETGAVKPPVRVTVSVSDELEPWIRLTEPDGTPIENCP
jgi:hypothetical protein